MLRLQDREDFLYFFLSLMCAEPPDLGWDPTMVPVPGFRDQFDITVHCKGGPAKVFRTLELLSQEGASALHGRGTRVWKVKEKLGDGKFGTECVLKDVWADDDRDREDVIMQKMLESIESEIERKVVEGCLLTITCAGDVIVNDVVDQTRVSDEVLASAARYQLQRPKQGWQMGRRRGHTPTNQR